MDNQTVKGAFFLMSAELIFLLSGYGIHVFLGRTLGPEKYGKIGLIISMMILIQVFLQKGVPLAVSKFIAQKESNSYLYEEAKKVQIYLALIFTTIFFFLAPIIATTLKDEALIVPLRISAGLIIPFALFSLYAGGFLNGKQRFKEQAITRIVNSLAKLVLIVTLIYLGLEINGVIGSYVIAAIISYFTAKYFFDKNREISKETNKNINQKINKGKKEEEEDKGTTKTKVKERKNQFVSIELKKIMYFSIPLVIYSFFIRSLRYLDLFFVKRIINDDFQIGNYIAAMNISEISLFIFSGFSVIMVPIISKYHSLGKTKKVKFYIEEFFRYLLILIVPLTIIIAVTAPETLNLLYLKEFLFGANALKILVLKTLFLSIFIGACSIVIGYGKPKIAMYLGLILIVLSAGLNNLLIPKLGLSGAALSATISCALGTIIMIGYILHQFKVFISKKSLLNILFSAILTYFFTLKFHFGGIKVIITYITSGLFYLTILFLIKEIKEKDLDLLKNLIIKKKIK